MEIRSRAGGPIRGSGRKVGKQGQGRLYAGNPQEPATSIPQARAMISVLLPRKAACCSSSFWDCNA